MILFVFGTHMETCEALKALGRPTDFFVVPAETLREGLDDYALARAREGRPLVIPLLPVDGRRKSVLRAVEGAVAQAKELGFDVVLETLHPKSLDRFVALADWLYVGGALFRKERDGNELG